MALDLSTCSFVGPALPEPFVKFDLEGELNRERLLPKATGDEGRELQRRWDAYRRRLRELIATGGPVRVRNQVIEPLASLLGYERLESADKVLTREEAREGEDGGYRLIGGDGNPSLRVWTTDFNADLDAPARRGAAYRYSHLRVAQRVLLASGERVGLLTNGVQLRLLLSDPARPDSQVVIPIDPEWKRSRNVPDSFRLLLAVCSPSGVRFVPELVDKARLKQARVTKELRVQARQAIEGFMQEVHDHPDNREALAEYADRSAFAHQLWREGLVLIYRLLFVLKGEASDDPARRFGFASTSLWRNTYSPSLALAPFARRVLDDGANTGRLLEAGLRSLFRLFMDGLECTELRVKPLGGALFGAEAMPLLSRVHWGERAAAHLLDHLLWTTTGRGRQSRERVHYGPLDVEDLGRVYEALLELEPGISDQPMCRLRRAKLEVVVPEAQGARYRAQHRLVDSADEQEDEDEEDESEAPRGRTRVEWVEAIPPGRFYLRVGLGRKASGSYYTPHPFVRFLVQETLGPQVAERSPKDDPNPAEILKLKVLDPAMGSGHFLVEACRFLGDALYEACRVCDEKATAAEEAAEASAARDDEQAFDAADAEMQQWRQRVIDLPDPDDELLRYLPSRAPEGQESGVSQSIARAICRRLVACHSLYGVDNNPLAVELAKLSLWLESQAEGLPLTFLDHRLVVGDSLTGPFWEKLLLSPGSQEPIENLFQQNLLAKFTGALREAIRYVGFLEASVGVTLSEIEDKRNKKRDMDRALLPFRIVAAAWSGGVMLGPAGCDDLAYNALVQTVGETGDLPERIESEKLRSMTARGLGVEEVPVEREALYALATSGACVPALPYDLTFPEVFYPTGVPHGRRGFHAVVGNPPWDQPEVSEPEYWAQYDLRAVDARLQRDRDRVITELRLNPDWAAGWGTLAEEVEAHARLSSTLYEFQSVEVQGRRTVGRPDVFRLFAERWTHLLCQGGAAGMVAPSAFHANEGATGIRRLYLGQMALRHCYSFENKRKLFEIHGSFKYANVVADRDPQGTDSFSAAFYLHDDEWLFAEARAPQPLPYSREFIELTGGPHLTFLECRDQTDQEFARTIYPQAVTTWGELCSDRSIETAFGVELHRDRDYAVPLVPPLDARAAWDLCAREKWRRIPVIEGKSIWQYQDFWDAPISVAPPLEVAVSRRHWARSLPFRLAFRKVAASTNERTLILAVLPCGFVCNDSLAVEKMPWERPNVEALALLAVGNAHVVDWMVRGKVGAAVNVFLLRPTPLPDIRPIRGLLAHSALRLSCNHGGYAPLWHEQLADEWREQGRKPFTWPVLAAEEERWEVRSAVDAVVAEAYGLNREQYEHVLHSFDRASGPNPHTDICLAKFDELTLIGLDAFTRKYDPYWDIPLVETLPEPVIELPIPRDESGPGGAPTNLLGEPVPTDLYGNPQVPGRRKKGSRRR